MKRTRIALLFILWIGLPLPSAFAHAGLVSSSPESGAHLTVMPSQVKLEFGENLLTLGDAQTNVLVVKDPDGVEVDQSNSSISGRFISVDLNSSSKSGIFTVDWRVVSEDGHPVEGTFQFSVASSLTATPLASPTPSLSATPVTGSEVTYEKASFWKQYRSRILLGILSIIAIIIWMRFKMREKARQPGGL